MFRKSDEEARVTRRRLSFVMPNVVALCIAASAASGATRSTLDQAAGAFMDAYVAGDWAGVENHLTKGKLFVYGSDLAEFSSNRAGFKKMFEDDQKLWRRSAKFGAMSEISSVHQDGIATLFFNRIFEVGGHTVSVRFSTVWRREGGDWKLVQSSNAVPTVGQTATKILSPAPQ